MPLSQDDKPPRENNNGRWSRMWQGLQNLQTVAFFIGWVVGIPAGALGAIGWGLWTTQTTYASMQRSYVQVEGKQDALTSRVDALAKIDEAGAAERAGLRERVLKLETLISPYIVTSEVIEKFGTHLGALDGRLDTTDRNLLAEVNQRQLQIATVCARLVGVVGASGRRPIQCP
jgi:hypothetical protein